MALRPQARNPLGVEIPELFVVPAAQVRDWVRGPYRSAWGRVFKALDVVVRRAEPFFPKRARAESIAMAAAFVQERLNGEDGLGAIYSAMANTVMFFDALGLDADHPDAAIAWAAVRKLLVQTETEAYCQPCFSPIWDTSLAGHAVAEAMGASADTQAGVRLGWSISRSPKCGATGPISGRNAPPGGWAFQYNNAHYPDVDDTAVVGNAAPSEWRSGTSV